MDWLLLLHIRGRIINTLARVLKHGVLPLPPRLMAHLTHPFRTLQLDGALLGSAALDFPGDGGVSNHMHHGAHDVYQHQQYQQQHNAHAMLPELPVGAHQQQNMQSLGVPGKALQSDSLAAFMDELKSSIMDP